MRGIVVIDQPVEDRVVGWQVNVGVGRPSAMAGAWVLPADDPRIPKLLDGRVLVTTERAAHRFGRGAAVHHLAMAILAETSWMTAVAPLNTPRIPTRPRARAAADPRASAALTLATWVAELLGAWDRIEQQRVAEPPLVARGGATARPLPPGWAPAESAPPTEAPLAA
ncbi:hypothetical protein [Modestobacter versicolor]|uniref:Uncharacterized protein n=1 Tax=Modestobacter versicolor TaxID=429133 RepID=A0A323VEN7_9ACTN|nr:hypothetical protein [Modestobacter versicolor]PZA23081.1 hypothetical protein DMO24_01535 [Modestobacter versicolor]